MRTLTVLLIIAMIAMTMGLASAATGADDGLSFNATTGASGYFSDSGAPYPSTRMSATANGWSYQGDVRDTYVSYKGGYSFTGVYDYDDYKWIVQSEAGDSNIRVVCDVELWCTESMSANEVYFHIGAQNASPMSAHIGGYMASNNGEWVALSKGDWGQADKADADNLKFLADGFGRTKAWFVANQPTKIPTDIPVAYALSQDGGATWQPGAWSGGNNSQDWGYWWLIADGHAGAFNYTFKITISPKSFQEDGRYFLDPTWTVMPAL